MLHRFHEDALQGFTSRYTHSTPEALAVFLGKLHYEGALLRDALTPSEFEDVQLGNCMDFARYAWVRLVATGVHAWLVLGQLNTRDTTDERTWNDEDEWLNHAWVVLASEQGPAIFETTPNAAQRLPVSATEERGYRPYLTLSPDGAIHRHRPWQKVWIDDPTAPRGMRLMRPSDDPAHPLLAIET